MSHLLSIQNLTVQRGDNMLCAPVSVNLRAGDCVHVMGENGIGKTTLLLLLAGVLPIRSGQATWHGAPPTEWNSVFIGHRSGLHDQLSVQDNLAYLTQLDSRVKQGLKKHHVTETLAQALAAVGLSAYAQQPCKRLSAGQRRRVQLARLFFALTLTTYNDEFIYTLAESLWLLDEPFTAIDTEMKDTLLNAMADFTSIGGRIIFTSHEPSRLESKKVYLKPINSFSTDSEVAG